ncbi:L-seryl-tRNA(Sec) selenium transferase [Jatrophihabitans sp. YIM 134969]
MTDVRRAVPRTDAVLADPALAPALDRLGAVTVKDAVRVAQDAVRRGDLDPDGLVPAVLAALPRAPGGMTAVVNATGVVVHTNLGRAPLGSAAIEALTVAAGPTDVEFGLESGARARRGRDTLAVLRAAVPAAGDVHVVNNAAAALVLCATVLAGGGREIVVSRGEMVEIGDGFRLPDLLVSTGAVLREVGTTNRTTVADHAAVIGPQTGFALKVHPSNFVVSGFTAAAPLRELAALPVPVVVDVGSGLLHRDPMLPDEPDVTSALRDGASVVLCSGDKLLGGPQCGLLFGDAAVIERLRRHPLARALRVDKLTLAALQATVVADTTPVREMLAVPVESLRRRARELAAAVGHPDVEAVDTTATVGGGGAPGVDLPSAGVAVPAETIARLRRGDPPVVGRVHEGRGVLDLRTVSPAADAELGAALGRALEDD